MFIFHNPFFIFHFRLNNYAEQGVRRFNDPNHELASVVVLKAHGTIPSLISPSHERVVGV